MSSMIGPIGAGVSYTTSNYTSGTTVNGKGFLLIFPVVASDASGTEFAGYSYATGASYGNALSSSSNTITVNIDNLGSATIKVNSIISGTVVAAGGSAPGSYNFGEPISDTQPITIPFTTSIKASGNGIQKAILYLES